MGPRFHHLTSEKQVMEGRGWGGGGVGESEKPGVAIRESPPICISVQPACVCPSPCPEFFQSGGGMADGSALLGALDAVPSYDKEKYMVTGQGAKFAKGDLLQGGHNITLGSKTIILDGAEIRGDLAKVKVGRECILGPACVISPSSKKTREGTVGHLPIHIGSNTYIGGRTRVEGLKIGSWVSIGQDCSIGARSVISDCCIIEEGTTVPPNSVLAPFSRWRGTPAARVGDAPDGFQQIMTQFTRDYYQRFLPKEANICKES